MGRGRLSGPVLPERGGLLPPLLPLPLPRLPREAAGRRGTAAWRILATYTEIGR